ncbi:APC family permease [uncultured Bifidobacterium sp.]|uniref:APC family permease n=1 Tax=uncultured Bifidobacterium sp. TaxID=165187 RepID=UPI002619FBCC|nr:APC family permease [uncultured Bifidobacterium sp.]
MTAASTADNSGTAVPTSPLPDALTIDRKTGTRLQRTMTLPSVVLFGLAYMTPIIVLGTFGVIAETSHGASAMSYVMATIAMLFTAASYGRMSVLHPTSGSAYTYVGRTIGLRLGFLTGWSVLLDYMFLPMVIWLIGASYLNAQFPSVPIWAWVLGFIILTTAINIAGLNVADKIDLALMIFQSLVIILFVALSIRSVATQGGAGALISLKPFVGEGSSLSAIVAGGAIAAYSFLGFDAVTTLSEETHDPQRTMPRAIMLIALVGGLIFIVVSYVIQLVHPGGSFADSSSAAYEVATQVGGNLFTAVFIAGLCFGQFTSGIAAQASASRLLYVMGRDGVLPKRFFGRLNARFATPVGGILTVAVVGLIAMFLDVATSTSFVNFGAFVSFTLVNVCVIVSYATADGETRRRTMPGGVPRNIVLPVLGALFCAYLLVHLDSHALILGVSWLCVGIIVLAFITHGFHRTPPQYDGIDAS